MTTERKCIAFVKIGDDPNGTEDVACENIAVYGLYKKEGKVIKSYCKTHWDNLLLKNKGQTPVKIDATKFLDGYYYNEFSGMYDHGYGPCGTGNPSDIRRKKTTLESGSASALCEVSIYCRNPSEFDDDKKAQGEEGNCFYVKSGTDPKMYKHKNPTTSFSIGSPGAGPISPRYSPYLKMNPYSFVGSPIPGSPRFLPPGSPKTSIKYNAPAEPLKYPDSIPSSTTSSYVKTYPNITIDDKIKSKSLPPKIIRGRFDIMRKDIAPKLAISEDMVLQLQKLEETTDLKDALESINHIRSSIESFNRNSDFDNTKQSEGTRWSVEETVINYIAEKFSPYISGPRLELLLSYVFDYDRRDLTKPFIFYGFTKFDKKIIGKDDTSNIIYKTPYDILQVKKGIENKITNNGLGEGVYAPRDYDEDILNRSNNLTNIKGYYKIGNIDYGTIQTQQSPPSALGAPSGVIPSGIEDKDIDVITKDNKSLIDSNKDLLKKIIESLEKLKA